MTTACLLALIMLAVTWELWLAPLRPGGSWLVLKAIPLLAPLFGLLHGRRYTFQWSSMLILAYIAEGIVRAMTDHGLSATLAGLECLLGIAIFALSIAYVRTTRSPTPAGATG
jgi:uncharacterized membrane protein